jgi:hypothetical protein
MEEITNQQLVCIILEIVIEVTGNVEPIIVKKYFKALL